MVISILTFDVKEMCWWVAWTCKLTGCLSALYAYLMDVIDHKGAILIPHIDLAWTCKSENCRMCLTDMDSFLEVAYVSTMISRSLGFGSLGFVVKVLLQDRLFAIRESKTSSLDWSTCEPVSRSSFTRTCDGSG